MEIKNITYERRFNLGQYEYENLTVGVALAETDSMEKVIAELQQTCIENSLTYKKSKTQTINGDLSHGHK